MFFDMASIFQQLHNGEHTSWYEVDTEKDFLLSMGCKSPQRLASPLLITSVQLRCLSEWKWEWGGTKQTSNYKAWVGRVKRQSKRQSCCTPLSQTITHPQRLRVPVDAMGAGLLNNPHQNVPKTVWATATVLWRAHLAASRVPLHILLAKSCKWATNQSHLFWVLKVQGEPQGRHAEFMMFARVFWSCDFAV